MKELTVKAAVESLDNVTDFINKELDPLGCPKEARVQIDVAIDEMFGNIANYAYGCDTGKATVRFEVEEEPLAVIITFIDDGKPFNPLENAEPDISAPVEERGIGGLGIFLVKSMMDMIDYEYRNGQNILKIKKKLDHKN